MKSLDLDLDLDIFQNHNNIINITKLRYNKSTFDQINCNLGSRIGPKNKMFYLGSSPFLNFSKSTSYKYYINKEQIKQENDTITYSI